MVGWMTYGKRKFEDKDAAMRRLIPPLHQAMAELIPMIDADTNAFNDYMAALALPSDTPERASRRAGGHAGGPAQGGRGAAAHDAHRGRLLGRDGGDGRARQPRVAVGPGGRAPARWRPGIWGAYRNVVINLPQIEDEAFRAQKLAEAERLAARAREQSAAVLARLGATS